MVIGNQTARPEDNASALRFYLDESGGDDPNTPHAIVGGMLIRREACESFENVWDLMLIEFGIAPPFHMKEFGKNGKLGHITGGCKRDLLHQVATIIKKHRAKTISASISVDDFKSHVPSAVTNRFGVYGMGFLLAAFANHDLAKANSYTGRIPFILDTGNPKRRHVVESHAWIIEAQNKYGLVFNAGSLTFADDKDLGTLQAADAIAWCARRRATGNDLDGDYAPLNAIFNEHHASLSWTTELVQHLGNRFAQYRVNS